MASNASEFDKTKHNSSPTKSSLTPVSGGGGKTRGVEHPIAEDMALIGDTRHELHTKALPHRVGPHDYGLGQKGLEASDQFRVDCGQGASGEC